MLFFWYLLLVNHYTDRFSKLVEYICLGSAAVFHLFTYLLTTRNLVLPDFV